MIRQTPTIVKIDKNLKLCKIAMKWSQELFDRVQKNREYLAEWLQWVHNTKSVDDTVEFIKLAVEWWDKNSTKTFVILVKDELVGIIDLKEVSDDPGVTEIGYWLAKKFTGQGIMSKSVAALLKVAKETGFKSARIDIEMGNVASEKIPRRFGFEHSGNVKRVDYSKQAEFKRFTFIL